MGQVKGRGAFRVPIPQQHLLRSRGRRIWGCISHKGQDHEEISERTSFLSGMVEKAPGIWSSKAEACL